MESRFHKILIWILAGMLVLAGSLKLSAQTNQVRGVISEKSGNPLAGVDVLVKGTSRGVTSDANGNYSIASSKGEVLVFSFLGFISQEVKVGDSQVINVVLQEDVQALNEAIAIGYGTIKGSRVTNSISKISGEDLVDRPVARIDQALQGKVSGVYVQEVSGAPGKSLSVRVRGTGSINYGSSPLYVVDGYPISGDLNNINPSDIESIEVLKDAASAAIYGSRGSNGVVLVTTKQGKKGSPQINLNISFGIQKRFSKVDVLNRDEYIEYAIEERTNSYIYSGGDLSVPEDKRHNYKYAIDPVWRTNPKSLPDNDWQDIIDRTAPVQNYGLSVSGATDKTRYYVSGNYLNQKGIIINSDYERLTFRSNVEVDANKYLTVGFNLQTSYSERNDPNTDSSQGPISRSILVAPIVGIDQQTVNGGYYYYHAHFFLNPLHLAKEVTDRTKGTDYLANAYAKVTILPNLVFKSTFGTDVISYRENFYKSLNVNRGNPSYATNSSNLRRNLLTENTLTYEIDKPKWDLNLLAGYTYQEEKYESSAFQKSGFPDDDIKTMNAATKIDSATGADTKWSMISYLARANFSYLDKYFLTASVREDGSSRFGKDNRWGTFPSVSGGWLVAKEKFVQEKLPYFSNIKLRASYGEVGNNNIGNYSAIGLMSSSNYVFGTDKLAGYSPSSFSNSNLGWEKTQTTDIGLDLGFLNDRLNVSLDYYIANTKDLLLNVPISETSGFQTALQNIGKIQNRGLEVELMTKNIVGKFNWSTNFNLSYNHNEVKKLGPDGSPILGYCEGFVITKTEIGKPIGYYYLFKTDGLFKDEKDCQENKALSYANKNPMPGDVKYKDMNGDNIIDERDRTNCGSNIPKVNWGMTNTFSLEGFDLSIFMDGVSKCKLINMGKKETTQSRGNVRGYWRNRWRSEENPGNGKVPRACTTDNLTTPSDWWLENAQFWRIRNINIGYTLPQRLIQKLGFLSSCRVYFSWDNVYMHDHYNHMSQNAPYSNSNLTPGVDYDSGYPLATTYQFGIDVKF
jgi:TonB-linked SusC/RagA family outer membrane protein